MDLIIRIGSGENNRLRFTPVTKEQAQALPEMIRRRFDAELGSVYAVDAKADRREYYIGVGDEPDFLAAVRIGGKCAKLAGELKLGDDECVSLDGDSLLVLFGREKLEGFIRGLWLGAYEPASYKNDRKVQKAVFEISPSPKGGADAGTLEKLLEKQKNLAKGLYFVRDMTNMPSNMLYPETFAQNVRSLMEGTDVEVEVFDYEKIKELGMGGVLAVGESAGRLPRFVILRYRGAAADKPVLGLVGKGVTVDTGGYCIKPGSSMPGMRGDMAGAAAVAASVYCLAANKEPVNVTALMPMCENRISRESFLPGDVLTMYDKNTVEVLNTDAEGRLILADAVAYGVKNENLSAVADIATLTGAVVSMLGFTIGGVITDSDELYGLLAQQEGRTEERYARIPFFEEHVDMIKSDYADVKNLGPKFCGTITAGLFIRHFAKGTPWMHFDIAGTAWMDEPLWEHQSKGATGAGMIGLYELAKSWSKR